MPFWLIMTVVKIRLQAEPNELHEVLESIDDLDLLKQLLERAALTESIEEFMQFVHEETRQIA